MFNTSDSNGTQKLSCLINTDGRSPKPRFCEELGPAKLTATDTSYLHLSCLPTSLLSLSHQRPLCRPSTLIQDSSNPEWVVDPPHAAAHQRGAPLPAQSPGSYVIADTECASITRTGLLQASTNLNTISEVFLFEKTVLQFNPYSVNLF